MKTLTKPPVMPPNYESTFIGWVYAHYMEKSARIKVQKFKYIKTTTIN